MVEDELEKVAAALQGSISLFVRQLRQSRSEGELTLPERSALARLDRGGPTTSAALARLDQISPQSMGTTLRALESRGLVARHADPQDGRRVLVSLTDAGLARLQSRRSARTEQLVDVLAGFTKSELKALSAAAPLIERLAQSL
jgi:DNA-binding MarR family transcriptional regulator